MSQKLFALVDCNNFFVSCERVFDPKLEKVPVVVLSNNDGCIVARSNKVKNMNVPMGAPYFKWKKVLAANKVKVLSSNFTLYGPMSARVMSVIAELAPEVEVYSVDEAFSDFTGLKNPVAFAQNLKKKIEQYTGIPVSIGVAPTKTLAKATNEVAKKQNRAGVGTGVVAALNKKEVAELLVNFPVGDIWGVGPAYTRKLKTYGINTAGELIKKSDYWIRKNLSLSGLAMVRELRGFNANGTIQSSGIPLIENGQVLLEEIQKSLVCSRSFGNKITKQKDLLEAISRYAGTAAKQLRERGLLTQSLTIFTYPTYQTGRRQAGGSHLNGHRPKADSLNVQLPHPTNNSLIMARVARNIVKKIFRNTVRYGKAGVLCLNLTSIHSRQSSLFEPDTKKSERLLKAYDKINNRYGVNSVFFGAFGINASWRFKRQYSSPHYLMDWDQLPVAKA
jgi:DNA polymerase V